jgi:apolipoprotein D and lipocalin family protein
VQVINRGFNTVKNEWKEAVGKALFTGESDRGSLKVSFFGPFYGGYHVVALDPAYRWSMVVGPDRDYLWILARDKQLDPALKDTLLRQAQAFGLPIDQLIWVAHTR